MLDFVCIWDCFSTSCPGTVACTGFHKVYFVISLPGQLRQEYAAALLSHTILIS